MVVSINIIDNMLETMEKYGQTLEEMVDERTTALLKEKEKTDKLLYSLMPKYATYQLQSVMLNDAKISRPRPRPEL